MEIKFKKQYKTELAKTLSGHWYSVTETSKRGKKVKESFLGHFPSVTTILQSYPFSEQLVRWMSEKGFHESRELRDQAGFAGTQIHSAVEALLSGAELLESSYKTEIWNKIDSFARWHSRYKPEIIALEIPVFSKSLGIAGRIDCVAKINDEVCVLDWKSSKNIHNSYYLQLAAYSYALEEITDLKIQNTAILQMGASNKDRYRFVVEPDWESNLEVFKAIQCTWEYDNRKEGQGKVIAPVLELPSKIKLEL